MKLQDLEKYREELISEHESELAAIDRLIARERSKTSPAHQNGAIESSRLSPRVARKRRSSRSLTSVVRQVVKQKKGEFTREDVTSMAASIYPIERLNPRTIGIVLWKMAKEGGIRTVQAGVGKTPAVYRKT